MGYLSGGEYKMTLSNDPKEKRKWAKKKLKEIYDDFSLIDKYVGEDEKEVFDEIKSDIDKSYGFFRYYGNTFVDVIKTLLMILSGVGALHGIIRGCMYMYIHNTKRNYKLCFEVIGVILGLLFYYASLGVLIASFFMAISNLVFYAAIAFVALYFVVDIIVWQPWNRYTVDDDRRKLDNQLTNLSRRYLKDFYIAYDIYFNEKNIDDDKKDSILKITQDEKDNIEGIELNKEEDFEI